MKKLLNAYGTLILLGLLGTPAGAAIGAVDTLFGRVLLEITDVRNSHPFWFIPFLAIAGILITWCYSRFGGKSAKGMGLIFEAGHGQEKNIPLRLIPFVISGTWLTHLFGGSAGREGVAVQIGAALAHRYGKALAAVRARLFKGRALRTADNTPDDGRAAVAKGNAKAAIQPHPSMAADNDGLPGIFLVAGMAAGFAGLFQRPLPPFSLPWRCLLPESCVTGRFSPLSPPPLQPAPYQGLWGLKNSPSPSRRALTPLQAAAPKIQRHSFP